MENNLQISVTKKIEELFNQVYKNLTSDTNNLFKFSTMFDFNYDGFKQYNENDDLITDKYQDFIPYIPVQVGSLIGDREPIPNVFIANVIIPITMQVRLEDLEMVVNTIYSFNDLTIGSIYNLDFGEPSFKLAFIPNLPDFDDFAIQQGETVKEISFELDGVLSQGVYYGNDITYSLSYDNGTTFHTIKKIDPNSQINKDLYVDQVINEERTKASEKTKTWTKSITILFDNSPIANVLFKNAIGLRNDKFIFKENYNILEEETPLSIERNVIINEISYSDDIGSFVTISFSLVEHL